VTPQVPGFFVRRCGWGSRCSRLGLRVAVAGGSSLPVEVLTEFEKHFGVPTLEGFSMSEPSEVVREDGTEAAVGECGG
jgi:acyl-CoA synthetase (AMP-forming)/AMP-acid ligase II